MGRSLRKARNSNSGYFNILNALTESSSIRSQSLLASQNHPEARTPAPALKYILSYTIRWKAHWFHRLRFFNMEKSLSFETNPISFNKVIESSQRQDIHRGSPLGNSDLRAHKFLELQEILIVIFFLHDIWF